MSGVLRNYLRACADAGTLTGIGALKEQNTELRRAMIECLGADRFFSTAPGTTLVHQDIDGAGNDRRLIRVPLPDVEAGYIQAVHVVCPTTKREYHLLVSPTVRTCQEAVASTFGIEPDDYHPNRET